MTPAMTLPLPDDRESLTNEQSAKLRHDVKGVQHRESLKAVDLNDRADEIRDRVLNIKAEIYGRHDTRNNPVRGAGDGAAGDSRGQP